MNKTSSIRFFNRSKSNRWLRLVCWVVLLAFSLNTLCSDVARADMMQPQSLNILPPLGTLLDVTPAFTPPNLKAISVDPKDPFKIDFILDTRDKAQDPKVNQEQLEVLIKYFLGFLTLPEEDLWVNLSPYEKERIVDPNVESTNIGKDMLLQDYMLKQLSCSLTYPEREPGRTFWKKVFDRAKVQYGTSNIPINSFNKVWVVPDRAVVYEHGNSAYVSESRLKVLLDEDYLSLQKHGGDKKVENISSQIAREVIIPEIEREVNEGKTFAPLRQMYNALILAIWFKKELKGGLISQVYANQKKTAAISLLDNKIKEKIYTQYLRSVKKGVYNFIREDLDPVSQEKIPHKYFSGGFSFAMAAKQIDFSRAEAGAIPAMLGKQMQEGLVRLSSAEVTLRPRGVTAALLLSLMAGAALTVGAADAHAGLFSRSKPTTENQPSNNVEAYVKQMNFHWDGKVIIDTSLKAPKAVVATPGVKTQLGRWIRTNFIRPGYEIVVHSPYPISHQVAQQAVNTFLENAKSGNSYLPSLKKDDLGKFTIKHMAAFGGGVVEPKAGLPVRSSNLGPLQDGDLLPMIDPIDGHTLSVEPSAQPPTNLAPLVGVDKLSDSGAPTKAPKIEPIAKGAGSNSNHRIVNNILSVIAGQGNIPAVIENGRLVIPVSGDTISSGNERDKIAWELKSRMTLEFKKNGLSGRAPVRVFFTQGRISVQVASEVISGADQNTFQLNVDGQSQQLVFGDQPSSTEQTKIAKGSSTSNPKLVASVKVDSKIDFTTDTTSSGSDQVNGNTQPVKNGTPIAKTQPKPPAPPIDAQLNVAGVSGGSSGGNPPPGGSGPPPGSNSDDDFDSGTTHQPPIYLTSTAAGSGAGVVAAVPPTGTQPSADLALPQGSTAGAGIVSAPSDTAAGSSNGSEKIIYSMPEKTLSLFPYPVKVQSPFGGIVRYPKDLQQGSDLRTAAEADKADFILEDLKLERDIESKRGELRSTNSDLERSINAFSKKGSVVSEIVELKLKVLKLKADLHDLLNTRKLHFVHIPPHAGQPIIKIFPGKNVEKGDLLFEYLDPTRAVVNLSVPANVNYNLAKITIDGQPVLGSILNFKGVIPDPNPQNMILPFIVKSSKPIVPGVEAKVQADFYSPGGPKVLQDLTGYGETQGFIADTEVFEQKTSILGDVTIGALEGGHIQGGDLLAQVDIRFYLGQLREVIEQIRYVEMQRTQKLELKAEQELERLEAQLRAWKNFVEKQIGLANIYASSSGIVNFTSTDQGSFLGANGRVVSWENGNFTAGSIENNANKDDLILFSTGDDGKDLIQVGDILLITSDLAGEPMPARVTAVNYHPQSSSSVLTKMQSVQIRGYHAGGVPFKGMPFHVSRLTKEDMQKVIASGIPFEAPIVAPPTSLPIPEPGFKSLEVIPPAPESTFTSIFMSIPKGEHTFTIGNIAYEILASDLDSKEKELVAQLAKIVERTPMKPNLSFNLFASADSKGRVTLQQGFSGSIAGLSGAVAQGGPAAIGTQVGASLLQGIIERVTGVTAGAVRINEYDSVKAIYDWLGEKNKKLFKGISLFIDIGARKQLIAQLQDFTIFLNERIVALNERGRSGDALRAVIEAKSKEVERQIRENEGQIHQLTIELNTLRQQKGLVIPNISWDKIPAPISSLDREQMHQSLLERNPDILLAKAAWEQAKEIAGKTKAESPLNVTASKGGSSTQGSASLDIINSQRRDQIKANEEKVQIAWQHWQDVIAKKQGELNKALQGISDTREEIKKAREDFARSRTKMREDLQTEEAFKKPAALDHPLLLQDNRKEEVLLTAELMKAYAALGLLGVDVPSGASQAMKADQAQLSSPTFSRSLLILLMSILAPFGSIAQNNTGVSASVREAMRARAAGAEKLNTKPNDQGNTANPSSQGTIYKKLSSEAYSSENVSLMLYDQNILMTNDDIGARREALKRYEGYAGVPGFKKSAEKILLATAKKYPEVADRILDLIGAESEEPDLKLFVDVFDQAYADNNLVLQGQVLQAAADTILMHQNIFDDLSPDYFKKVVSDPKELYARVSKETAHEFFTTLMAKLPPGSRVSVILIRNEFLFGNDDLKNYSYTFTLSVHPEAQNVQSRKLKERTTYDVLAENFSTEDWRRAALGLIGDKEAITEDGKKIKGEMNEGTFNALGTFTLPPDHHSYIKTLANREANIAFLQRSYRLSEAHAFMYDKLNLRANSLVKSHWTKSKIIPGDLVYPSFESIPTDLDPAYFISLGDNERVEFINHSNNLPEVARTLRVSSFKKKEVSVDRLMKGDLLGHVLVLREYNTFGDLFWPLISEKQWFKLLTKDVERVNDPASNEIISTGLEKLYKETNNTQFLYLITRLATDHEIRKIDSRYPSITPVIKDAAIYRVALGRAVRAKKDRMTYRYGQFGGKSQLGDNEPDSLKKISFQLTEVDASGLKKWVNDNKDLPGNEIIKDIAADAEKSYQELVKGDQYIPPLPVFQWCLLGFAGVVVLLMIGSILKDRILNFFLSFESDFNKWTREMKIGSNKTPDKKTPGNGDSMSAAMLALVDTEYAFDKVQIVLDKWQEMILNWSDRKSPEEVLADLNSIIKFGKAVITNTIYKPELMFVKNKPLYNQLFYNTLPRLAALSLSTFYYFYNYVLKRLSSGSGFKGFEIRRCKQFLIDVALIGLYAGHYATLLSARGSEERAISLRLPKGHWAEGWGGNRFMRWILGYNLLESRAHDDINEHLKGLMKTGNLLMPNLYEDEDGIIKETNRLLGEAMGHGSSMVDTRPFKTRRSDRLGYYYLRVISVFGGLGGVVLGILGLCGVGIFSALAAELTVAHILIVSLVYCIYWRTHIYSSSNELNKGTFRLMKKAIRMVESIPIIGPLVDSDAAMKQESKDQSGKKIGFFARIWRALEKYLTIYPLERIENLTQAQRKKAVIDLRKEEAVDILIEEGKRPDPNVDIIVFVPQEDKDVATLEGFIKSRKEKGWINEKAVAKVINPIHLGSGGALLQVKDQINRQFPDLDGKNIVVVFHGKNATDQGKDQKIFLDWSLARGYLSFRESSQNSPERQSGARIAIDYSRELGIGENPLVPKEGLLMTTSEVARSSGLVENRAAYVYTELGLSGIIEILYGMKLEAMEGQRRTLLRAGTISFLREIALLDRHNLEQFTIGNGLMLLGPDVSNVLDEIIKYLKQEGLWNKLYLHFTLNILIPLIISSIEKRASKREELFDELLLELRGLSFPTEDQATREGVLRALFIEIGRIYDEHPFKIDEYRLSAALSRFYRVEGEKAGSEMERIRKDNIRLEEESEESSAMATSLNASPAQAALAPKAIVEVHEAILTEGKGPGGIDLSKTRNGITFNGDGVSIRDGSSKVSLPLALKSFQGFEFQISQFKPITNSQELYSLLP